MMKLSIDRERCLNIKEFFRFSAFMPANVKHIKSWEHHLDNSWEYVKKNDDLKPIVFIISDDVLLH